METATQIQLMTKHTPTPWKVEGKEIWSRRMYNRDDCCVAISHGPNGEWGLVKHEHEANAKHIVHCVNNFDALLEALSKIIKYCEFPKNCTKDDIRQIEYNNIYHQAQQAINQAEKEVL